ncbi:glucans biosynthesis glucosyltransferase MdoH [Lutibaculum baratangense]|uniref:Glucans biosynthesis glucosyltransferase H n=1 Tax=Lutibaculum baratangense AMV1 TaxID=631454 RepID=V4RHL1_9HYPH|nr:glucans biosynthesis glucosyltransferase MdoH [Lutibaculum baratangense]ESR24834.1 Glucans biosynthesis glucosyltransferase H [Lutibaculum baratangense AMV1]
MGGVNESAYKRRGVADVVLPPEAPLAMPAQDLRHPPATIRELPRDRTATVIRAGVVVGTLGLTAIFSHEMYAVLAVAGLTSVEAVMLVLFVINIAWIALSAVSAVAGFAALGRRPSAWPADGGETPMPRSRTAILIPAYNEDPARVFAAAAATAEGLAAAGAERLFDIYVLADTTDPDVWVAEEVAYRAVLRRRAPRCRIFYRRRRKNTERKAGNVADWVRLSGGAYPFFICLDADSLMQVDTLLRLAATIEANPDLGLLQTVPMLANRNTVFARMQQFAGRVYGRVIAAGLASWTRSEGNYWGHNAIIRTRAFAEAAGLPHLRGKPPFGGHILSHDFVEAALMRRAGWQIQMAPTLDGSYEESPPTLIDLAQRDRRWCQGNLQHSKVLPARGLHWISRVHLGMGIMSYLASPIWLAFLLAGLVLALQAHFIRPEYFTREFQLFPTWPVIDSERAIGLFIATMLLLFTPKFLGLAYALLDEKRRRAIGGGLRGTVSLLVESLISAVIAPILMAIQSAAVIEILIGRDSGWNPQRRDDGSMPVMDVARRHFMHMMFGIVLGVSAWLVSPHLLAWMSPAVAGLVLAIPASLFVARRDVGLWLRRKGLMMTPEEQEKPAILTASQAITEDLERELSGDIDAYLRLSSDPALLAFHRASLPPVQPLPPGEIDMSLVAGLARLEAAETLEDAIHYLSKKERLALLADPEGLDRVAMLPRRKPPQGFAAS